MWGYFVILSAIWVPAIIIGYIILKLLELTSNR